MPRPIESNFPKALRHVRTAVGLTQEDFDQVSSRVYISILERGVKNPTLPKIDALANAMGVHPLTLLALAYCKGQTADEVRRLFEQVVGEVESLSQSA